MSLLKCIKKYKPHFKTVNIKLYLFNYYIDYFLFEESDL